MFYVWIFSSAGLEVRKAAPLLEGDLSSMQPVFKSCLSSLEQHTNAVPTSAMMFLSQIDALTVVNMKIEDHRHAMVFKHLSHTVTRFYEY